VRSDEIFENGAVPHVWLKMEIPLISEPFLKLIETLGTLSISKPFIQN
jgi:hypothetical protein